MLVYPVGMFNGQAGGGGGGGGWPSYRGWEFESGQADESSTYTFSHPGSPTYAAAVVNNGMVPINNTTHIGVGVGTEFMQEWSGSGFAITCWIYLPVSFYTFEINMRINDSAVSSSNRSFRYYISGNQRQFQVWNNSNSNGLETEASVSLSTNTWHFCYMRYDPANNKQVTMGVNNTTPVLTSAYTVDIRNDHASTRTFSYKCSASTVQLDQLVFWYDGVLTDGQIETLYNSGSGAALP